MNAVEADDTRNDEIITSYGDEMTEQERTSHIKHLMKVLCLLLTAMLFPGCGNVPVSQKTPAGSGEKKPFILQEITPVQHSWLHTPFCLLTTKFHLSIIRHKYILIIFPRVQNKFYTPYR